MLFSIISIPFKIPIFLVFSLIILLLIRIFIKKGNSGYYNSLNSFFERENKSNLITKNINSLDLNFINVSEEMFPFKDYENTPENEVLIKLQEIVKRKLSLKMIKFNKYFSNTELKEMYGINNFEKISLYEEHFKGFIFALYDWAKELYNKENTLDAKKVLLVSTSLNADISRIYTLLADIYVKEKEYNNLKELKKMVENSSLNMKNKILDYINKLI